MQNKTAAVKSASGSSTLTGAPVGASQKVKYKTQDGDAHYEIGIEYGVLYAEQYYFLYPSWTITTIHIGRKRALVTKIWTAGFDARSYIENQKYISVSHANAFMQRLFEVANEKDDVERQALTLQLARNIIDVIEADYK